MDKSRVEPSISFIEKIKLSLKLFSAHFYGQSFIKTVRGPYEVLVGKLQVLSFAVQEIGNFQLSLVHFIEASTRDFGMMVHPDFGVVNV